MNLKELSDEIDSLSEHFMKKTASIDEAEL